MIKTMQMDMSVGGMMSIKIPLRRASIIRAPADAACV